MILSTRAPATSGDLIQYVEIDGKRYSHIIDPRTGIGLTDRSTVSVVATDGTTADSYASDVSVLRLEEGLRFIEVRPGTAVRIEYLKNHTMSVRKSSAFRKLEIIR